MKKTETLIVRMNKEEMNKLKNEYSKFVLENITPDNISQFSLSEYVRNKLIK